MKLAKTITIIVLSVLLAISAFFNIFITSMLEIKDVKSFKQVLLCRELIDSMGQLSEDTTNTDKPETPNIETTVPEVQTKEPNEEMIIYNEKGVKISYVAQELGLLGPSLKFFVENNTDQTLDVCLTDIYIDGFKADLSSMYCSSLGAGKKAYESLTLYEFEYEDFSDFPSVIQFVVKIKDSASWNTIVETELLSLPLV
jgi:hypothetical protein